MENFLTDNLMLYKEINALVFMLAFQGRGFNVQIHYVEEPVPDYIQAAVSTILLIHDQVPQICSLELFRP